MKTLRVNLPNREYDILIGKNLLDDAGDIIKERFAPPKAVIVTDENVNALYGANFVKCMENAGIPIFWQTASARFRETIKMVRPR